MLKMRDYVGVLLTLCLLPASLALADTVSKGRVYIDLNGNGVYDRKDKGVGGVKVSNGRDIAVTDRSGRYRLTVRDGDTLFVIKPAGYRFPMTAAGLPKFWQHHFPKGSQALKYGAITPVSARRTDFALIKEGWAAKGPFDVVVIADSQVRSAEELAMYERSIIAQARRHSKAALGLTLGDLVNDTLDLYPELNRLNAQIGVPWLHAPGNHDIDFDVADDETSLINYRRTFGPDTVAWEREGHAFIALDDVIYQPQVSPKYVGGFREEQFEFLGNYLKTLSPETQLVFSMHIPMFDDPVGSFRPADRERFFALIKNFRSPLILSGHSHSQRHYFHTRNTGWKGAEPLHEFNVGAACGGYWGGQIKPDGLVDARMEDGSPNGYVLMRFESGKYTTRYFASGQKDDDRIALTSPGVLRRGAYPAHALYANVYAAEPDAVVEYRINEGEWLPMSHSVEPDPALLAINHQERQSAHLLAPERTVAARPSWHLWVARVPTNLAVGEHRIEVRAMSRFEGELRATTHYQLEEWIN